MNNKLTEKQADVIRELYENDEGFREVVRQQVNRRVEEAQKLANMFGKPEAKAAAKAPAKADKKPRKQRRKAKKGQPKHPVAILEALGNKNLTRSEIAQVLSNSGHDIDDKTLNTTLYNMKKSAAKGKSGLTSQGDKGSMKYSAQVVS